MRRRFAEAGVPEDNSYATYNFRRMRTERGDLDRNANRKHGVKQIDTMDSSNLLKVLYDYDAQKLTVHFKSGGIYEYDDVPAHVFEGFQTATSAGKYFWATVRGAYNYTRLK